MMKRQQKSLQLLADNRRLSKKLIEVTSKLDISEQKCLSIETAFELSQKLNQHLKTDNRLLRATQMASMDMFSMVSGLVDQTVNNLMPVLDSNMIESNIISNQSSDDSIDPNSGLCRSDLIAIQYENQIKELLRERDLLDCVPLNEVLITNEDQRKASSYLSESESENESRMDVSLSVISPKMSETSETKSRLKCKYCGKRFATEEALDEHKSRHFRWSQWTKSRDSELILCAEQMCGQQFDSKHKLKDHLKSVHRKKQISDSNKRDSKKKSSQNKQVFNCSECDKQLSSKQGLTKHLKSVHIMRADQQIQRNSITELNGLEESHPIVCQTYTTPENTPQSLSKKRFICEVEGCHSSYAHKQSLTLHAKKHHSIGLSVNSSFGNIVEPLMETQVMPPGEESTADDYELKVRLDILEKFLTSNEK